MYFRQRSKRPEIQLSDVEMTERESGSTHGASSAPVLERLNIEEAVRLLPPGYRVVFIMHDVAGYEHKEIARSLGYSAGNSKSQLHRARTKLRELLSTPAPALGV